jgi:hypothetical protein
MCGAQLKVNIRDDSSCSGTFVFVSFLSCKYVSEKQKYER